MKKANRVKKVIGVLLLQLALLAGCGSSTLSVSETDSLEAETVEEGQSIVVGFSQLGAESDWRSANTASMLDAFSQDKGYTLIYKNGQQKQSNQITAIRTFIQQDVDYILLAPATESGWESVLQEAKEAKIPVILVDRRVEVVDDSLYTCWIGSDFELEAKKMAAWLKAYTEVNRIQPEEIHVVNIQGTIGSTAQIGRSRGLRNAALENGWDLMEEISGDFTETKGREVMAALLKRFDNINVVYCENDNEAMGAIDALESAGKKVGSNLAAGEVMVVSFDGVNEEAKELARTGKISCIAECNPLHGPRVEAIVTQLQAGQRPDKYNYVDEKLYSAYLPIQSIEVDGQTYEIVRP